MSGEEQSREIVESFLDVWMERGRFARIEGLG